METVINSFISQGESSFPNINDYADYEALDYSINYSNDFSSPYKLEEEQKVENLYRSLDIYFKNTDLHPFLNKDDTWEFKRGIDDGVTEAPFHIQLGIYELHRLFLLELEKMESCFEDYLNWLQADKKSYSKYISKSEKLFDRITKAPFAYRTTDDDYILTLSFNYTQPLSISNDQYANIHGSLQDHNLFFGIDGEDHLASYGPYMFFKHSRYLEKMSDYANGCSNFWNSLDESNDIHAIKFFGTSLGDADYPYFKHILQKTRIEEGHTFLGFYYTEGANPSKLLREAIRLLDKYADDISYPRGKNLSRELQILGKLGIFRLII